MADSAASEVNYLSLYSKLRQQEANYAIKPEFISLIQPLKAFFREKKTYWSNNREFSSETAFALYTSAGICLDLLSVIESRFSGIEAANQDKTLVAEVFESIPLLEGIHKLMVSLESMGSLRGPSFLYQRVLKDIEAKKKKLLPLLKKLKAD